MNETLKHLNKSDIVARWEFWADRYITGVLNFSDKLDRIDKQTGNTYEDILNNRFNELRKISKEHRHAKSKTTN